MAFRSSMTVEIENVGTVLLQKNKQSRYLRISVKADGTVRLTMPARSAWQHGIEFIIEKKSWIVHQQRQMLERQKNMPTVELPSRSEMLLAKKKIAARVTEIAGRFGYKYNRLTFRRQRTLWGSCSANNNISLNINLMMLPDELADYVILHELVHTKVKDHSDRFWSEMDGCLGAAGMAKRLRKKLRGCNIVIK